MDNNDIDISDVYLGYTDTKNDKVHLLAVYLSDTLLDNICNDIHINNNNNLPTLREALEDPERKRRSFALSGNILKENNDSNIVKEIKKNYSLRLIRETYKIYNRINKDNPVISALDTPDDLINNDYSYVIYAGANKDNHTKFMSVYLLKKDFTLQRDRDKIFKFVHKFVRGGESAPKFSEINPGEIFQLPLERRNNIANLYVKDSGDVNLIVYRPKDFDDVFHTYKIEKEYAQRTLDRFIKTDKDQLKLTEDNIAVKFNDLKAIKNKVFHDSDDDLMNSMATFTGNENSTINQVSEARLIKVLDSLSSYPSEYYNKHHKNCNFQSKNIPKINKKDNIMSIDVDTVPVFCSLLRNRIIKKLLSGQISIPYYNKHHGD